MTNNQCFIYIVSAVANEDALSLNKYLSTSFYISPEKYGKKSDVYALGVIYFEMNYPFGPDEDHTEVCH